MLALVLLLSTSTWGGGAVAEAQGANNSPGAVYAMTNDATNNEAVIRTCRWRCWPPAG